MVFSSLIFIFIFLPIFLLCYFICRKRKSRNLILLIFSLLFYGYGEPLYLFLMLLSIIINYFLALEISKKPKNNHFLVLSLVFNLGLLFLFKYCNFFIENITNLFNLNINYLKLSLPIGISFYTFQILTYVIDVYRKKVPVQKNIINLGCYISAFPQLIAGPIVRYSDINEEINNRQENYKDFADGIRRFIIGLAKKAIIANEMAYVADTLFSNDLIGIGFIGTFIAIICYTFQIYFDFSGYSDMAIGLGRMLGFHYLENFNYPYVAKSITDFWRRWHISLSSFFRDYVYIPLGGNRCSKAKNILNISIVWLLTGLWHGASWNFIIWGLYYGLLLILEKFVLKKIIDKFPNIFKHIYTIIFVVIGWLIFYFTDLSRLYTAFRSLLGMNGLGNINILFSLQVFKFKTIVIFLIAIVASTPILKRILKNKALCDILLILIFLVSIVCILASSYNPFIYFRF